MLVANPAFDDTKYWSALVPTFGGSYTACPRLFRLSTVAVAPKGASKNIPTQAAVLGNVKPLPNEADSVVALNAANGTAAKINRRNET